MCLEASGANFRTLQVLQDADAAVFLFGGAPNSGDILNMFGMRSVGEIQPGHIHAPPHEIAKNLFGIARRTNGTDDFGAAVDRKWFDGEIARN
jgi:hypothetical protein